MSKKVLILSGSPRRGGNSDLLCDELLRGAAEAGGSRPATPAITAPRAEADAPSLMTWGKFWIKCRPQM